MKIKIKNCYVYFLLAIKKNIIDLTDTCTGTKIIRCKKNSVKLFVNRLTFHANKNGIGSGSNFFLLNRDSCPQHFKLEYPDQHPNYRVPPH